MSSSESGRQPYRSLLDHIWARKWSVALVTLTAGLSALYFSTRQAPLYLAESKVLVRAAAPLDVGVEPVPANMATVVELVRSLSVARVVLDDLELDTPARELLEDLSVENPPGSDILVLTFTHESREIAREVVGGFADVYLGLRLADAEAARLEAVQQMRDRIGLLASRLASVDARLERTDEDSEVVITSLTSRANNLTELLAQERLDLLALERPVDVGELIQPAIVLGEAGPGTARDLVIGLVLGLLLGIAQAALRGSIDNRVGSVDEAGSLMGSETLAMIPVFPRLEKRLSTLTLSPGMPTQIADAFASLRVSFLAAASQYQARVVLVTSASAREGRTTVTACLGVSLARVGETVTVVCADPGRHRLEALMSLRADVGLTQVVHGAVPLTEASVTTGVPRLNLLACGRDAARSSEVFHSDSMRTTLESLGQLSDFVLVDGPPLSVADGIALLPYVDAVLFVTDLRRVRRGTVVLSRRQLARAAVPVLGLVFNRAAASVTRSDLRSVTATVPRG